MAGNTPLDAAALTRALERRPDVRVPALAAARAGADASVARAAFLPGRLQAAGSGTTGRGLPATELDYGVAARLNIFARLGNRARLREPQAAIARGRLGVEAAAAAYGSTSAAIADSRPRGPASSRHGGGAQPRAPSDSPRPLRARSRRARGARRCRDGIAAAELQATAARVDASVAVAALDRAVGR